MGQVLRSLVDDRLEHFAPLLVEYAGIDVLGHVFDRIIRIIVINIMLALPLWERNSWRMWVDAEVGLIEGKIVDALESDYLAKQPAKETDLFIPFVHLMWQQASYPAIVPLIVAISDDFPNMGPRSLN